MANSEEIERAASAARELGRFEEAAALYRQAIELKTGDASLYNDLGVCLLQSGKPMEAAAAFEQYLAADPNNSTVQYHLGLAFQNAGNHISAAQCYRKAINLAPEVSRNYSHLGHIILIHGNRPGAIKCFRKVHELEPGTAYGLLHLGLALIEEANPEEAALVLSRALELAPGSAQIQGAMGSVLQQLGRFGEAETHLQEAIRIQPNRAVSYFNLAYGKRVSPSDASTLETMRGLLAERPSEDDAQLLHYALGKGYDDLGRYGEAIKEFDEANRLALAKLHRSGRRFDPKQYAADYDRIIERFKGEFAAGGSESEKPIFILGLMRSGTTLVEQILSSHSGVAAGGELRFWLDKGWDVLDNEDPSSLADEYLSLLTSLSSGLGRVTDKMPHNFEILGPIHTVFPRARIIHCKRLPVDNALSIYVTPYRTSPDFAHDRENIVFATRQHQRLMAHWRTVLPRDQFLEVHYEELVSDRERVSREMIDFCGLEWEEAILRPEANARSVKTASLWQVRQPVYDRSVARWKGYEPWLGPFRKLLDS